MSEFNIVDLVADNCLNWGVCDESTDLIAAFRDREDASLFAAIVRNRFRHRTG